MWESRRGARSVGSGVSVVVGMDVADHGFNGFVEGEIGGVDFDGVFGAEEGADGTSLVAHVALKDLLKDFVLFDGNAFFCELCDAAACAFLGVGVEEKFERGLGEDDGALIASFGDEGAGGLANEALLAYEFLADPGVIGGDVGDFGDAGLANGVGDVAAIEVNGGGLGVPIESEGKKATALGDSVGVVEDLLFEGVEGDGTVHRAGIQMGKAHAVGKLKCCGGFTGTGWPINSYNHFVSSRRGVANPYYHNLGNLGEFSCKRTEVPISYRSGVIKTTLSLRRTYK